MTCVILTAVIILDTSTSPCFTIRPSLQCSFVLGCLSVYLLCICTFNVLLWLNYGFIVCSQLLLVWLICCTDTFDDVVLVGDNLCCFHGIKVTNVFVLLLSCFMMVLHDVQCRFIFVVFHSFWQVFPLSRVLHWSLPICFDVTAFLCGLMDSTCR